MKQRVLTAVVLAPIVLGAFFFTSPVPLLLLAALAAYIGGREASGLLASPSQVWGVVAALLVFASATTLGERTTAVPTIVAAWAGGVLAAYAAPRSKWLAPIGLFWVSAPLATIVLAKSLSPGAGIFDWRVPALLAIVPLWGGDTAAIFAGKAFGRHLLAPKISPKKTWEGAIANFLACVLVAGILGPALGVKMIPSLACGVAAGILGQAGDLFESSLKRRAGLKDSGALLPGHGGLLDRIDSILFTAPAVALILAFA